MLLNVSRTPAPESWLTNLAEPPSYSALDKEAYVTLEKSRFSISTVDSELFPELLSWSTLMNALPHSRTQSIPSDITKRDTFRETVTIHDEKSGDDEVDTVTVHEANLFLSSILDPTTLAVGFDQSCFDDLDGLIIHDPFEAFAEICWIDAVGHNESTSTPIPTDRDGDVGKILTYYEEAPVSPSLPPEQNLPWSTQERYSTFDDDDDDATSFVIFEAPALAPNRYDSVGHYPIPSSRPHRNVVSNRIATFCSNLPAPFSPLI